ncbi:Peptidase inhibitor I78 family protein [compost metagenome]|uniref:Peptidase inhibitor I78 family protein n=1 Tax=Pseudomonas jinjuensis TaxID=198616 RepID=A0A1H0DDJ0_9PSED|nr:I78 family peptidase inhibitor [Pseudomonas jinjuensis]SDN68347.1 Peptidase inhibitor I78 family protein [Pseudomonas jinjuensis]
MSSQRIPLVALFAVALLAGCSSTEERSASPDAAASGRCNAEPLQSLVGRTVSASLLQEAKRTSGAQVARVLRPNDVMTMDYNSQRLNIDVDAQQVIRQIHCG